MVYEVEFDANGMEYDYEINALTGEVVRFTKEADDDADDGKETEKETENENSSIDTSSFIGEEAAKEKALAHAGVAVGDVREYECELDEENGVWVYEISFNAAGYEYDYEIDAVTGEVIRSEKELD